MNFNIICAVDEEYGFGINDNNIFKLPWKNELDMKFFKNKTIYTENPAKKNAIIMGNNTFNSINKVLPNRENIVITKESIDVENIHSFDNFDDSLKYCKNKNFENVYVIGGAILIKSILDHPQLKYIYLNKIKGTYNCNIKLYNLIESNNFDLIDEYQENDITFYKLENILYKDEYSYLNLMKTIINNGVKRNTRNDETISVFGESLSFNLKDCLPILTSKKIFIRGIIEELIWFLKGHTDSKLLENKNVNIWKGNSSKEFLDSMNLDYEIGDIGPMYGFNLLHYGANYKGCNINYENEGLNQLKYCMELLEKDPFSRRIIMTTYNPLCSKQGVLYPCHGIAIQFYINEINNIRYLSCNMYQRSADMFLGVPFNITSYSLLCYIICEILNNTTEFIFKPDKLNFNFGDSHLYVKHLDSVQKQFNNKLYKFPSLEFKNKIYNFNDLKYDDFNIDNYKSNPIIKAKMIC